MTYERHLDRQIAGLNLPNGCLFSSHDLKALLPHLNADRYKSVMHHLCKVGYLERLCKNLFLKSTPKYSASNILFRAANKLREDHFMYLSLETVLSREGRISQVPMQWISLMTSGRSYQFKLKNFGTIEFIHTQKTALELMHQIHYDHSIGLWVASSDLALHDMKNCHRDLSLVDEHEPI
jgi:hypothetical protein